MKKHQFHCEKCNSECMIYKKGKNHRVLVCPECGVLATNGIFKSVLKRGGRAILGEIPGASLIMEGAGLVGDISKDKKEKSPKPTTTTPHPRSNSLEKIRYALGG